MDGITRLEQLYAKIARGEQNGFKPITREEKFLYEILRNGTGNGNGGGISVTGATVGQTVKIAEVDETGKPTAWEPVDFPSGGEEAKEWEEFLRFTTDNAETTVFDFSSNGTETLESKKVKEFYLYSPRKTNTGCGTANVLVNDRLKITNLQDFGRDSDGECKLALLVKPNTLDLWYFGRDTDKGLGNATLMNGVAIENGGLLVSDIPSTKILYRRFTDIRDGVALPTPPVDYIKTVVVTTAKACASGVEFIVYVR